MGRAGRGGGGSRGSSFGGSRGFSSHSGSSHRSSSRSSWSSSSRSYHHSYHSSRPSFTYINTGGNHYSGSYGSYRSNSGRSYVNTAKIIRVFIIIMIALVLFDAFADSSDGITKSTVEREKLVSNTLVESDEFYTDKLDWIKNRNDLESGMRYFYNETGVQPYLFITDTVDGDSTTFSDEKFEEFANNVYDSLFMDEAHLLVVFFERNEEYRSCCVVGTEAKTVMDEEAREILLDYIDYYYYSDLSEEMFFSKSFSDSADRIMTVNQNRMWVVGVFIVAAVILYILYKWWRKRKQHKLDEMNAAEKILGSDLGEFGTYNAGASAGAYNPSSPESDIDELKKKYDN